MGKTPSGLLILPPGPALLCSTCAWPYNASQGQGVSLLPLTKCSVLQESTHPMAVRVVWDKAGIQGRPWVRVQSLRLMTAHAGWLTAR